MRLHLSKCHIVGNHMSWLNYDFIEKYEKKNFTNKSGGLIIDMSQSKKPHCYFYLYTV